MFVKINGVYLVPAHITAARWQVYTNLPPKLFVYLADGRHESFEGDAAEAVLAWLDAHAEDLLAWQRERGAVYGETATKGSPIPANACPPGRHRWVYASEADDDGYCLVCDAGRSWDDCRPPPAGGELCEQGEHDWDLSWWCKRPGCNTFRRDWERQQGDREQRESLATVRRVAASCE